jgi:endonuclease/exonuclease/phosphatase family metal-dependent hydrolase
MAENIQLKVATYNIQFAINLEEIIWTIKRLVEDDVSFICIQEIINRKNEEFIVDILLNRLGKEWSASYNIGPEISKVSIGTAILWNNTKAALKHEEKIFLPKIAKFDFHENFYYELIGVPAVPLQRKVTTCYFSVNHQQIRISSVHLDNVGGPKHRMKQLAYLSDTLQAMPAVDHDIICGDFNTFDLLKTGQERKSLQSILGNEYTDASGNVDWSSDIHMIDFSTSYAIFPWFINTFNVHIRSRLDYIWVRNFNVDDCQKKEQQGSDHFPLVATLTAK